MYCETPLSATGEDKRGYRARMAVYSGRGGANTALSLRVHSHITQETNHWVHSTEKGKTIWFFNKNPSHPPAFNNNNNLCYEQLPYKSNYLRRVICYVWKKRLVYECSSQGTEA